MHVFYESACIIDCCICWVVGEWFLCIEVLCVCVDISEVVSRVHYANASAFITLVIFEVVLFLLMLGYCRFSYMGC